MAEWKTKKAKSQSLIEPKLRSIKRVFMDDNILKAALDGNEALLEWNWAPTDRAWSSSCWTWARTDANNCVVLDSSPDWIDINTDPFA